MAFSVLSIFACLKLQRMAKESTMRWDGSFDTLPQPQRSLIWFLSYMQTVPTLTIWLVIGMFGKRHYYDRVPLPVNQPLSAAGSRPALYIGATHERSQLMRGRAVVDLRIMIRSVINL